MGFVDLLGESLQSAAGSIGTSEALVGKTAVALYFSGHDFQHCRLFTLHIAEWYNKDLRGKGLEVVLVSLDESDEDFSGYLKEMPWLALPYADREKNEALSKKSGVRNHLGVLSCRNPSLVILEEAAGTITKEGRTAVSEDPGYCNWVKTKAQQMQADDFKDFTAFLDAADGGDTVLEFGRMRGKTFGEVARSDPKYCAWFLKSAESAQDGSRERSANCVAFIDFLRARGPGASESRRPRWQADAAQEGELASGLWEVSFGKHRGSQFKDVYETDMQYCMWLLDNSMHGERRVSWEVATFLLYVQHRFLQERGGAPGGPTH